MRAFHFCLFLVGGVVLSSAQANEADRLLQQKDPVTQSQTLGAIVRSAGDSCPGTRGAMRGGQAKNGDAIWYVRCDNDKAYAVQVKNDAMGSTRVTNCAAMKSLNVPCFKKY